MAVSAGASVDPKRLHTILNKEELKTINKTCLDKIESYIDSKINEAITNKVAKDSASGDGNSINSKYEQCKAKLEAAETILQELEAQLSLNKSELSHTVEFLKKNESDLEEVRKQRNNAVDERDHLKSNVEKKDREIERLQGDIATLTTQLEKAINDKCEAFAHVNEVQNKEFALNFKEQHIEQERNLLKTQIKGLSDELSRSNNELQTIRFTLSQRINDLEGQIQQKNDEFKIFKDTNDNLNEVNRALQSKNESLTEKLLGQHELEQNVVQNYRKEIESKSKLADLYKSMQEDAESKSEELTSGITELQKLLTESVDKYGELETKYKQLEFNYDEMQKKKDLVISSMKKELENANELLQGAKDSSISRVLEKMSPLSGITGQLLHSNMSVTQLYTHLNNINDELSKEREENRRTSETLNNILLEFNEKTSLLEELKSKYEEILENNASITKQLEVTMIENSSMRSDYNEATRISSHFQKENEKLKRELADLGRQVCYLLKEIQITKTTTIDNDANSTGDDSLNASNIISKHLVTFSDIQELQANNQKLLKIIRELTNQQEENEKQKVKLEVDKIQNKCKDLETRVCELSEELKQQTQMMDNVIKQRDMYRKQCLNSSSNVSMNDSSRDESISKENETDTCKSIEELKTEVNQLKSQLNETKTQLDNKLEEFNIYKEESVTNQKMLVQQIEDMRKEMNEVTSAYSKAAAQLEFLNEKQNTLQLNISTYKKQIASLEERNHNYNVIIGKHEQTIKCLRNETMTNQSKFSKAEVQVQSLQREVSHLKNVEIRLSTERDLLLKEKQGQTLLMTNLELIKASLERSEAENCVKLESKLDEANGEIVALRRSLQEEQERFRELTFHLQKDAEHAKTRMEEEQNEAIKLRAELGSLRDELKNKTNYIEEISKKFSSAINPTKVDGSFDSLKRVKELESHLNAKQSDLISLQQQLDDSKLRIKQYCDISEETKRQLQDVNSQFENMKKTYEEKLHSLQESENSLRAKCSELEAEMTLRSEGSESISSNQKTDLAKLIERLKTVQNELKEKTGALEASRVELAKVSESLQVAEDKYAHEMILHSNDIKTLTQTKEKLLIVQQSINELENAKTQALNALESGKLSWEEQEKKLLSEKLEMQARFSDLNSQNSLLLDQVQALSTKLSVAAFNKQSDNPNNSFNTSVTADTSLNRSVNEDEVKSSEKLVQIIKFLRKERDITLVKLDILESENNRIKSEFKALEKKLEEANMSLSAERQKLESDSVSSTKNSEIIRKIETLDAITDSNRVLREERDKLLQKVNSLTESTSKLEETLIPLQQSSKENSVKLEFLQSENNTLKSEVSRWRTRVNALVEKANKTSPEDWKRLQNEREILAKMLTTEKDNVKKLNEELNNIKNDKIKCEDQLSNISKQNTVHIEESKKQSEELSVLRKDAARISQELADVKDVLNQKQTENESLQESVKQKETMLNELKNKEMQIRKIAKKYKSQFEELTKAGEEEKVNREKETAESAFLNESLTEEKKEMEKKMSDLEKSYSEKIANLESRIKAATEENTELKSENEVLKGTTSEKEEKAKQVLKQAKTKIMQLTENNEVLTKQLTELKGNIETAEQNKEENDTRFELLTAQYESRVNKVEKEKNDSIQEKQQEIVKLNKEIESLNHKISQLQRHVSGSETAQSACVTPTPTPTANIKPMAAHSATQHPQQAARRGETPFASIRPMASTAARTAAVLPSPSSSGHSTEYMPAGSSAGPRPPAADSPPHPPQALVLPRVEEGPGTQPTPPSHSSQAAPPRPSLKRKPQQSSKTNQTKRIKVQQGQVSESHCETEYQVPTSSRRDHDDDGVVMVDSEDEVDEEQHYQDNYREQIYEEDEEAEADDGVDEDLVEGGEGLDGEVAGVVIHEGERGSVEVGDNREAVESGPSCRSEGGERQAEDTPQEPVQSECEVGGSEASVSQAHPAVILPPPPTSSTSSTPSLHGQSIDTQHTVSSGTQGDNNLVVERVSVQSVYEESGDDGIVPSTPTLQVPRRTDGFGEAVSSPVGTGRFTFTSSSAGAIEDTHADLASQLSEGVSGSGESGISTGGGIGDEGSSSAAVQEGEEGREAEASSGGESVTRRPNMQQQMQQSQQQHRPVPIVWSPHHGGGRGQHPHHRGHPGNNRGRRPNRRPYMRY